MRRPKNKKFFPQFFALLLILLVLVSVYLFCDVSAQTLNYNIPRRLGVLAAIAVVALSVGLSTVVFQTVTENYILTPGIMGLDNLYIFIQGLTIYLLGNGTFNMMASTSHFVFTLIVMMCASVGIFLFMFKLNKGDIYFVVLSGLIFGMAFGGLSSFMQVLMDPSEFSILEGRMFASFNRINMDLLGIAALVSTAVSVWMFCDIRSLNAIVLGRRQAIALGVEYKRVVLKSLIVVALLTSASTALVGPVTFLGILVVSIARHIFPTFRHDILIGGSILTGLCALVFGMLATERVMQFSVPLGVIINFVGGLYFIYLMLKVKRV